MLSDPENQQLDESLLSTDQLKMRPERSLTRAIKGYDPYQCPPNLDLAMSHGIAKRIYRSGANTNRLSVLNKEVCPCCGLPTRGELIPLGANLSEIFHLGSGYALYFQLTKYCITLLTLIFVINGFFNFVSNAAANDCPSATDAASNSTCVKSYILTFTISNARDHTGIIIAQMALGLVSMLVIIAFTQYMRYNLRKMHIEVDDKTITPADYTIKVSGLEPNISDEEIKEWIQGVQTSEKVIKCRKINRTYHIARYMELKKKKGYLKALLLHNLKENKRLDIEAELEKTESAHRELKQMGLVETQTVLITFEKAYMAAYVIDCFQKYLFATWFDYVRAFIGTSSHNFNGKQVFIERAPEPTDILWENLGHSSWQKFKRRSITKLVAAIIIAIGFVVIVIVNWAQTKVSASDAFMNNPFVIHLLSGLGSLLIVIINLLLSVVTQKLAQQENHSSFTSYFTGVARKLSVSQVINTAFTTLLAEIVLYNRIKQNASLEGGIDAVSFYGSGGLLEDMFYVFITNSLFIPLLDLIDPLYILKLYQRYKARQDCSKMMQQEAQTIFEEPEMDLAVNHSWLLTTVLMCSFYASAIPVALVFGILGLIGNYWIDKYLLLRRTAFPISLQNELCNTIMDSIEWMGFLYALGNAMFLLTLPNSDGVYLYHLIPKGLLFVTLGLGFFLAILPMGPINEKLFPIVDEVTENITYDSMRAEFATDYEIQNPVTSKEGLHEQSELLKRKKILIPKIRKNLRMGVHLLFSEKFFKEGLQNKSNKKTEDSSSLSENQEQQSTDNGDNQPFIPKRVTTFRGVLQLKTNKDGSIETSDINSSTTVEESALTIN